MPLSIRSTIENTWLGINSPRAAGSADQRRYLKWTSRDSNGRSLIYHLMIPTSYFSYFSLSLTLWACSPCFLSVFSLFSFPFDAMSFFRWYTDVKLPDNLHGSPLCLSALHTLNTLNALKHTQTQSKGDGFFDGLGETYAAIDIPGVTFPDPIQSSRVEPSRENIFGNWLWMEKVCVFHLSYFIFHLLCWVSHPYLPLSLRPLMKWILYWPTLVSYTYFTPPSYFVSLLFYVARLCIEVVML